MFHLERASPSSTRPLTDSSPAILDRACNDSHASAVAPAQSRRRPDKRQRHISDDSMDCSNSKRMQTAQHSDGALLCLPLQPLSDQMTSGEVGMELARCLHEPKYNLLKDAVEVLGVERTVEFFTKTAETQEQGGVLSADGDKKRAPGGVFFSLVKSSVTEEERKRIFTKDNRLAAKRAKQLKEARRKKKWKENEDRRKQEVQNKAQKQLERFRKELGNGNDDDQQLGHPPDRNMERRGRACRREDRELEYFDLDDPGGQEEGELIEGWRNGGCDDDYDDFACRVGVYEHHQRKLPQSQKTDEIDSAVSEVGRQGSAGDGGSLEERMAAEQFERTDECDLDFGIDLSCNF